MHVDCASRYNCEENGGIFVFAFPSSDYAMQWATEVQVMLDVALACRRLRINAAAFQNRGASMRFCFSRI